MGTTEELARFIAETHYDDLPAAVVAAAKIGILDGVANMLAGSTQPVAQLVSAYTLELGGTPVSSVIGHGFKTNPLNAAFANGVFGHCLDFELQGQPSSHGTSSILPGPLALAEAQGGASGKELIAAYVLGWDVQQRIVTASHSAGADIIMGHGVHVITPIEVYKDKPIFYGLGCFSFNEGHGGRDSTFEAVNWLGLLARVTIEDTKVVKVTCVPVRSHREWPPWRRIRRISPGWRTEPASHRSS